MTKTEIKDTYAKSVGYESWSSVKKAFRNGEITHKRFGELENGLLQYYAMECLKKASESALITDWSNIKDQYARDIGYDDWNEVLYSTDDPNELDNHIDAVSLLRAKATQ